MNITTLRVRAYECDSLGHVNNAVYLQYLQHATGEAFETTLEPRQLAIEYHLPAKDGDELNIETWVVKTEPGGLTCAYEITRAVDHAPVVRAQISWGERGGTLTWNAEPRAVPLKPFALPSDHGANPFRWHHTVRRYELASDNQVALAAYFNWLEEATYHYADRVGYGMERLREENFIVLQRRHDAEFFEPARYADEIEIVSRLIEVRRVRGTWVHEIFRVRSGARLVRDYSTGAFMDWQGNIKPALMPMMDALRRGG